MHVIDLGFGKKVVNDVNVRRIMHSFQDKSSNMMMFRVIMRCASFALAQSLLLAVAMVCVPKQFLEC